MPTSGQASGGGEQELAAMGEEQDLAATGEDVGDPVDREDPFRWHR